MDHPCRPRAAGPAEVIARAVVHRGDALDLAAPAVGVGLLDHQAPTALQPGVVALLAAHCHPTALELRPQGGHCAEQLLIFVLALPIRRHALQPRQPRELLFRHDEQLECLDVRGHHSPQLLQRAQLLVVAQFHGDRKLPFLSLGDRGVPALASAGADQRRGARQVQPCPAVGGQQLVPSEIFGGVQGEGGVSALVMDARRLWQHRGDAEVTLGARPHKLHAAIRTSLNNQVAEGARGEHADQARAEA
mmetsp:Transcript_50353/g.146372  ORF Transcript_50353/g.146372 Transcript_50353/m.146372 type:complete len:248 (-) Transcript_50353:233-976(-)